MAVFRIMLVGLNISLLLLFFQPRIRDKVYSWNSSPLSSICTLVTKCPTLPYMHTCNNVSRSPLFANLWQCAPLFPIYTYVTKCPGLPYMHTSDIVPRSPLYAHMWQSVPLSPICTIVTKCSALLYRHNYCNKVPAFPYIHNYCDSALSPPLYVQLLWQSAPLSPICTRVTKWSRFLLYGQLWQQNSPRAPICMYNKI